MRMRALSTRAGKKDDEEKKVTCTSQETAGYQCQLANVLTRDANVFQPASTKVTINIVRDPKNPGTIVVRGAAS